MCRTATDKVCNSLVSHVPIKEITSLLKTISLIRTDLKLIFNGDSEIYKKACQHHFILPHMTNVISEITHSILNFHSRLISAKIDNSWDCSQSLLTLAIRDRDMLLAELNLPIHRSELPSMLIQLQQSGGHNRNFRRKYMNTLSTSNLNIEVWIIIWHLHLKTLTIFVYIVIDITITTLFDIVIVECLNHESCNSKKEYCPLLS